jgi:tetratricopeptide (TPR) repeat protein
LYDRGEYQKATAAYLEIDSKRFPCTVAYDLANVYARLGEHKAAAGLYEEARRVGAGDFSSELSALAYFNEGLSLYEQGRFEEAWRAFRSSLSSSGRDAGFRRDAQYNLELAWRAWKKRTESAPPGAAPTRISSDAQSEAEIRLFERLETGTWRPGKKDSSSGGPDY